MCRGNIVGPKYLRNKSRPGRWCDAMVVCRSGHLRRFIADVISVCCLVVVDVVHVQNWDMQIFPRTVRMDARMGICVDLVGGILFRTTV